jgi:hypothetical protein
LVRVSPLTLEQQAEVELAHVRRSLKYANAVLGLSCRPGENDEC